MCVCVRTYAHTHKVQRSLKVAKREIKFNYKSGEMGGGGVLLGPPWSGRRARHRRAFALRVSRGGCPGRARAKASGDSDDDSREEVLQDVTCAIGGTPVVRLDPSRLGYGPDRVHPSTTVLAKLEFQNPGGSVKDRIAVQMIDKAEKAGLITPGKTTLVEATSGNTGIAIAMVGAARGYRVVVAMPRVQAMCERYILIRSFGGQVLLSDPKLKSQGFLDLAETYQGTQIGCHLL